MHKMVRAAIVAAATAILVTSAGVSSASATTGSSNGCTVTASTPSAVYVSPSIRIQGNGSAKCNRGNPYEYASLNTVLQQYSSYFHTWSNVANTQTPYYGGPSQSMSSTASYTCANGTFRTAAQVEIQDINKSVVARTTPVYSASFVKSNC